MKIRLLQIWCGTAFLLVVLAISACSQPLISPTVQPVVPFLDIFPVYPGTSWTYERIDYERYLDQTVTATYQISETVSDAQVQGPSYIAHLAGKEFLVAKDAGWVDPDDSKTYEFWYVLQGNLVYKAQQAPDPANLSGSTLELVYQLPMVVGASWCPAPVSSYPGASCENSSGQYRVLSMQPLQSKAGIFDGCYQIRQFFNDGSFFSVFCLGVGPAGMKFDHNGTPFGFTQTLTAFKKGGIPQGITIPSPSPLTVNQTVVKTCTLVGCGSTIQFKLSGNIPPDFSLRATGPDGSTAQAHCVNGQNSAPSDFNSLPSQPVCSGDQVSFTGFSPITVTILVTWGSQSMTLVAAPAYETLQPNGPGCEPACRIGTVSLNF